jgi:hypothetical protein
VIFRFDYSLPLVVILILSSPLTETPRVWLVHRKCYDETAY